MARREYAHTVVLWRSFWLQSTKTCPAALVLRHGRRSRASGRATRGLPEREREALGRLGVDRRADARPRGAAPSSPTSSRPPCSPSWSSRSRSSSATRAQSTTSAPGPGVEVEHDRRSAATGRRRGPGACAARARRGWRSTPAPGTLVDRAGGDVGVGVERHGVEPGGPVARAALLEEPLALDAVGQPHHGERPVVEVGEHAPGRSGRSSRRPGLW